MADTEEGARKQRQAIVGTIALVVVGLIFAGTWLLGASEHDEDTSAPGTAAASETTVAEQVADDIPGHVRQTLEFIDAGQWPEAANAPGTRGGGTFRNNEGLLPATDADGQPMTFQEWDVNPKAPNRGRDAERIVTGSDGSAWYTDDHYASFVLIRGPADG